MHKEKLKPWCDICTGTVVSMIDEIKTSQKSARIVATLTENLRISPDDQVPVQLVIDLSDIISEQLAATNAIIDAFFSSLREEVTNDKSFDSEAYDRHWHYLNSKYKFNDKI